MSLLVWFGGGIGVIVIGTSILIFLALRPKPRAKRERLTQPPLDFLSYYNGDTDAARDAADRLSAYQAMTKTREQDAQSSQLRLDLQNSVARRIVQGKRQAGVDRQAAAKERHLALVAEARAQIIQRIGALRKARAKAVTVWEDHDSKGWESIKRKFYDEALQPALVPEFGWRNLLWSDASKLIDNVLSERIVRAGIDRSDVDQLTPLEYEQHCADLLQALGWVASVTIATGDQGADIIATKNGLKAVIQCKLYSKPVGNGAVQEAVAARDYYRADLAAVVSNAAYTSGAQAAALASQVALLHHAQLAQLGR